MQNLLQFEVEVRKCQEEHFLQVDPELLTSQLFLQICRSMTRFIESTIQTEMLVIFIQELKMVTWSVNCEPQKIKHVWKYYCIVLLLKRENIFYLSKIWSKILDHVQGWSATNITFIYTRTSFIYTKILLSKGKFRPHVEWHFSDIQIITASVCPHWYHRSLTQVNNTRAKQRGEQNVPRPCCVNDKQDNIKFCFVAAIIDVCYHGNISSLELCNESCSCQMPNLIWSFSF